MDPSALSTTLSPDPPVEKAGAEALSAAPAPGLGRVLTAGARALVVELERELRDERAALLRARRKRQERWDSGELPDYLDPDALPESHGDWKVAPLPQDLMRRRVEITGPVSDPKMVINMLSRTAQGTRADAAMLDFEDAMKPSWRNVVRGVVNLQEAVAGTLRHEKRDSDGRLVKEYTLDPDDMPLLMVRVRGLHLQETNVQVDGRPVSAGLLDLTLSAYHTARELVAQGKTPKYYVPKVEHHLEARWWNRLMSLLEDRLELERSTLRATFLIETLPAAFQMEEILWELREHAAGLNGGRWDKIFSDIKVLKEHPDRIMADRGTISMNRPWMRNYALLLIRICHRHGAFAMGGMAAFTPGRTPELREEQTRKVVEDKEMEASFGHDGCWVSHPYFIGPAMEPFTEDHQLHVIPQEIGDRPDLVPEASGPRTMEGLRKNVRVGIGYMHGWNQDIGCVAWDDLMEDLATLEISRAQVWQWLRHEVELEGGQRVTPELVGEVFRQELAAIEEEVRRAMTDTDLGTLARELARFHDAAQDAEAIFTEPDFRPFLTCRSERFGEPRETRRAELRDGSACGTRKGLWKRSTTRGAGT